MLQLNRAIDVPRPTLVATVGQQLALRQSAHGRDQLHGTYVPSGDSASIQKIHPENRDMHDGGTLRSATKGRLQGATNDEQELSEVYCVVLFL